MKPIIAVPAISALVYRAYSRKSLTPLGIVTAFVTAITHAIHPWSVFFALLATFFLAGTAATKVKHEIKARLTQSANGSSGGEGARTHTQVLANSLAASILILLHTWVLSQGPRSKYFSNEHCWRRGSDVLVVGIVANYAAVTADTLSSELGILSSTAPRLITAPWKVVPKGTNGGVTFAGLLAGFGGSFLISAVSSILIPWCNPPSSATAKLSGAARLSTQMEGSWTWEQRILYLGAMTAAGFCGTILDSLLGALLQASVVDTHSGLVVEGAGGGKVLLHAGDSTRGKRAGLSSEGHTSAISQSNAANTRGQNKSRQSQAAEVKETRKLEVGRDILDNNAVNFVMATTISFGAMIVAAISWGVPLDYTSLVS
ncbi:DUF92 domain protein [Pseudovirgaria hyperparasitica]|uniref:DUF92 domain protein n=1 Tax=Pseudovirgaria hyperparasitica TaxID=470096 RepID=A0A6A6WHQ8_9PEZI|nr:DUF92 domain protein [Pseudovirgaria hyperparasitica]KAF2761769.1 DUF92 domain protein [Pseudovirgaria hyperparasitica]